MEYMEYGPPISNMGNSKPAHTIYLFSHLHWKHITTLELLPFIHKKQLKEVTQTRA